MRQCASFEGEGNHFLKKKGLFAKCKNSWFFYFYILYSITFPPYEHLLYYLNLLANCCVYILQFECLHCLIARFAVRQLLVSSQTG